MEAAKPVENKIENTSLLSSIKISKNTEKNEYYQIDFLIDKDTLIIQMIDIESKIELIYENKFIFSFFLKINKYFKMFDTLEEIVQDLNELNKKGLIKLSKNIKENYDLILNIELNKEQYEIKLELLLKDNKISLSKMSQNLDLIEKKYELLEKENKELKDSLSQYKLSLDNNEKQLKQLITLHQMNSSIMITLEELNLITKQIEKNMNKKVIDIKQLYKGTRDGEGMNNIKQRAFNIENIILLVRSKSGRRFGGFTSLYFEEISGSDYYKSDDKSFVFSLDKKDIYPIVNKDQSMRLSIDRAFMFGPNDIWIYGNFLSGKSGNGLGGYTYQRTFDYKGENAALSGINGEYFALQEVEAYQVIYEG